MRLDCEYAAAPSMTLYEQASAALAASGRRICTSMSNTPPRSRAFASALAAAALYTILRRDEQIVDVDAVALAMDQPVTAVQHAWAELRVLPGVPRTALQDPSLYIPGQLAWLGGLGRDAACRALGELHAALLDVLSEVRTLALQLARVCGMYEMPWSFEASALGFAVVIHALEGTLQQPLHVRPLAALAAHAADHAGWLVGGRTASPATVLVRYAEVEKMLAGRVAALPWVAQRPRLKRERDRARRGDARSVVRADVARHMQDAVQLALREPSSSASWMACFGTPRGERTRIDRGEAVPLAARLGLSGASIDTLDDARIDALLFEEGEMASYLRRPAEREAICRIRGWSEAALEVQPEVRRAPTPDTDRPAQRIRIDAGALVQPLDLARQMDHASEWDP